MDSVNVLDFGSAECMQMVIDLLRAVTDAGGVQS